MAPRYILGMLTLAATIFAVGQALALQTLPGEPQLQDWPEAACDRAVPPKEPLATGRVVSVDPVTGRLTLEFRPILEFLPEGGTRIFDVKEPARLEGLRPGDKVRFEVERDGRRYTVTHIENSN